MRFPLAILALVCVVSLAAAPARAADLFDGKDLSGWSLVDVPATDIAQTCRVTPDGAIAVGGKPIGYLLADGTYKNFKLHAEWRWPADASPKSNSGILVFISSGPSKTWPTCFQVQMKIHHAGDLLPMEGAQFAEPLSTPPGAKTPQLNMLHPDSEKPFGEWNACDVVCRDGTLECTVNGVLQNKVTGCNPAAGRIGFQLEGTPYELRAIRIEPLP